MQYKSTEVDLASPNNCYSMHMSESRKRVPNHTFLFQNIYYYNMNSISVSNRLSADVYYRPSRRQLSPVKIRYRTRDFVLLCPRVLLFSCSRWIVDCFKSPSFQLLLLIYM